MDIIFRYISRSDTVSNSPTLERQSPERLVQNHSRLSSAGGRPSLLCSRPCSAFRFGEPGAGLQRHEFYQIPADARDRARRVLHNRPAGRPVPASSGSLGPFPSVLPVRLG